MTALIRVVEVQSDHIPLGTRPAGLHHGWEAWLTWTWLDRGHGWEFVPSVGLAPLLEFKICRTRLMAMVDSAGTAKLRGDGTRHAQMEALKKVLRVTDLPSLEAKLTIDGGGPVGEDSFLLIGLDEEQRRAALSLTSSSPDPGPLPNYEDGLVDPLITWLTAAPLEGIKPSRVGQMARRVPWWFLNPGAWPADVRKRVPQIDTLDSVQAAACALTYVAARATPPRDPNPESKAKGLQIGPHKTHSRNALFCGELARELIRVRKGHPGRAISRGVRRVTNLAFHLDDPENPDLDNPERDPAKVVKPAADSPARAQSRGFAPLLIPLDAWAVPTNVARHALPHGTGEGVAVQADGQWVHWAMADSAVGGAGQSLKRLHAALTDERWRLLEFVLGTAREPTG